MPSIKDLYWLAGLLEGEGCFTWNKCYVKGKYTYYRAKLLLGMTDLDVVQKAATMIGVSTQTLRAPILGRKQMYRFECQGKRAIGWMQTLYPLLGTRRQAKVRDILSLYKARC